jgi:hypothetical protein
VGSVLTAALVVVALNAGHVMRTVPLLRAEAPPGAVGGAAISDRLPPDWTMYVNTTVDPRAVVSNALRNGTLHLTVPSAPVNGWLEGAVVGAHRAMGFDPNDRRTTLGDPFPAFHVGPFLMHEDFVGNPLHFVAALVAGVVVWRRRGALGAPARLWAALAAASALAFLIALKWQPWNSRLHLPLFVLACPLIGLAFEGRRRLAAAWAAAFCVLALPSLLISWPRTLVGQGSVLTMPPPLTARMAMTIDSISHGRFGVNLVTGWQKAEYDQMGLWPGESHYSDRYNYLGEYATVLKELMETGVSDFKGKYLQMHDCRVSPHPKDVKIICAGSSDEGLAFTAQYADYSFALGKGTNTPTAFAPVNARLAAAKAKTGRDVGSYILFMIIADETDEKAMAKWQLYRDGAMA